MIDDYEEYNDYKEMFNACNLKRRPYIELYKFFSTSGNIHELITNIHSGFNNAGLTDESKYFYSSQYSRHHWETAEKVKKINYSYDFICKMLFSMAETNVERDYNYIINEEIENDNVSLEKGKRGIPNYYGRNVLYYKKIDDLIDYLEDSRNHINEDSINDNKMLSKIEQLYDLSFLFKKDKLGMNILDHYIMSEKYSEYIYLMNFVLFMDKEKRKELCENMVFGENVQKKVCHSGINITLNFVYSLTMSENINTIIENQLKFLDDVIQKDIKANTISANNYVENTLILLKNMLDNISDYDFIIQSNKEYSKYKNLRENLLENLCDYFKKKSRGYSIFKKVNETLNIEHENFQLLKIVKVNNNNNKINKKL